MIFTCTRPVKTLIKARVHLFNLDPNYLTKGFDKMTEDTQECPYCGEVFHYDDESSAITKEGIHRAEEHVNNNSSSDTKKTSKGSNIVRKWKSEGKRA